MAVDVAVQMMLEDYKMLGPKERLFVFIPISKSAANNVTSQSVFRGKLRPTYRKMLYQILILTF